VSFQLTFDYRLDYDAGQAGITLPVTLRLSQKVVGCEAKVDTGSTFSIFARQIGEDLGLGIESGIKRLVGTVTGTFEVYLHEVTLSLPGLEPGIELDALVGFAADEAFQRNVLGRRGFLEQTVLGLVDYEGRLYLRRYNSG
jgi:hypothetical protein